MAQINRKIVVQLYRSLWRWTNLPIVKKTRFVVPLEAIPAEIPINFQIRSQKGCKVEIQRQFREVDLTTDGMFKRIDAGFEALRNLNTFTDTLHSLDQLRSNNADRSGIHFRLGQVIRHKKFGYRGVIIRWDKRPQFDVSQWDGVRGLPSGPDQPFYHVLPDFQDCIDFLGHPRDSLYVAQENMEVLPLEERRIDNFALYDFFDGFDPHLGRFLPREEVAFQFPNDNIEESEDDHPEDDIGIAKLRSEESLHVLSQVTQRVETSLDFFMETLSMQLQMKRPKSCGESGLLAWPEPMRSLSGMMKDYERGHHIPVPHQILGPLQPRDYLKEASHRQPVDDEEKWESGYRAVHNLMSIFNYMQGLQRRRQANYHPEGVASDIYFQPGQVVRHKKFNYRGVIYGWDRRPVLNVRGWEGVVGLPSGDNQPFYYVIPDEADCLDSFNGPRIYRYVAQENLNPVANEDSCLSSKYIELAFEGYDILQGQYIPHSELRYKHPGKYHREEEKNEKDLENFSSFDDVLSLLLQKTELFFQNTWEQKDEGVIPDLLFMLKHARTKADADLVENLMFQCWWAHLPLEVRGELEEAMSELKRQYYGAAIMLYEKVLIKYPELPLAEAYQKLATCHFLMGRYDKALECARQALEMNPHHYQAMVTAGEASVSLHQFDDAIDFFLQAIELNPWANVGSSLMKTRLTLQMNPEGSRHTKIEKYPSSSVKNKNSPNNVRKKVETENSFHVP